MSNRGDEGTVGGEVVYPSPAEALRRLMYNLFADNDRSEALRLWDVHVRDAPDQARIMLDQIDHVLADPPDDLERIMQEDGNVYLYDANGEQASRAEYVEWLRNTAAEMAQPLHAYEASPEPTLRVFLGRFVRERTRAGTLSEWESFAREDPDTARATLARLRELRDDPPADLGDQLATYGWVRLYHDSDLRPYTPEETRAWWSDLVDSLGQALAGDQLG